MMKRNDHNSTTALVAGALGWASRAPRNRRRASGMASAIVIFTLAACGASVSEADQQKIEDVKAAVRDKLRDPESAQFSSVKLVAGLVCGEVNSKNGFGGYVGKQHFWGGNPEITFGEDVVISTEDSNPCELYEKNMEEAQKAVPD